MPERSDDPAGLGIKLASAVYSLLPGYDLCRAYDVLSRYYAVAAMMREAK